MPTVKTVTLQLFAKTAEAQAQLDAIAARAKELGTLNPEIKPKIDKAAVTAGLTVLRAEMKAAGKDANSLSGSISDVGKNAAKAGGAGGIGALVGAGGGGGMGALIGAATALVTPITTIAFGLAGFGLAAYGAAAPILKASQATGGLAANMSKLNPEQQKVAQGLLGLGHQFGAFEKSLQPQVLSFFNQGIRLAGHLLHDVQPVAKSTGQALGLMLGQIDKEFQSGTWQSFFGFMARTAGPDVALLTKTLISLQDSLPPLLKLMQPTGTDLLAIAAGLSKLVDAGATASQGLDKTTQHENVLAKTTDLLRTALFAPGVGLYYALKLIGVISSPAAKGLAYTGYSAATAQQKLLALNKAADALSATWTSAPAKAAPATDAITRMAGAAQAAFAKAGTATDAITRLGTNSRVAAGHVTPLTDAITRAAQGEEAASKKAGPLSDAITRLLIPARTAADRLQSVANAVKALNTQETTALGVATAYAGSLVTTANDAHTLAADLKLSHDQIGLHTQAQRNSFGAANTYITDLGNTAKAAFDSGHGVDASIRAIKDGLPILDSAKTKNRAYWEEVRALVGWLDQLKRLKNIHESVKVSGSGSWTVVTPGKIGLPGGTAGGPFPQAAGGLIRGGVPGKDSVLINAMPGEVVVPANLVTAGAVDHLRGRLPGFASGGVVPSYGGSVAGLHPWAAGNMNAQVHLFEQAIASATFAGMKAAARAASIGGVAGPGGGAPAANAALAHRLYASQLTPASWAAWNYVAMRESGWSQFARNPSSGAYGIAQALPPTKYPFAGQAAGGSNPTAQITWMWNYMAARYGGPLGAEAHEMAFNWYDRGGWLPRGLSLALNTTGRPERVGGGEQRVVLEFRGGAEGRLTGVLLEVLRKEIRTRGGNVQLVLGRA